MTGTSVDEQRQYYDELWAHASATQLNNHEQARLSAIRAAIERHLGVDATDLEVLEVGCGRGWLSGLVLARYGRIAGYDLSQHSIQKARQTFPEVRFEVRDVVAEPPAGAYDLVVCSEVIEHIEDQRSFAVSLADALKPGGLLVVTTPNARLERYWRESGPGFKPQPIEQWLAPNELEALLRQRCEVLQLDTFFFELDRGGLYRLINGRMGRRARRHLAARNPLDALASRLKLGLYQLAVARRSS